MVHKKEYLYGSHCKVEEMAEKADEMFKQRQVQWIHKKDAHQCIIIITMCKLNGLVLCKYVVMVALGRASGLKVEAKST